jgi:nucleotide-binding universal stress UspA family protein
MRYAGDREIDLIVMGTHGRSGVAHAVMGSVAEAVIRQSSSPVLIVRRP